MKTITTLLIAFVCSISFGQTFTGKIVDKQNQPIPFANVVAKSATDNSLITGVISDENGEFSIELKNKSYSI